MARTPEETRTLFDQWANTYDRDLQNAADQHTTGPLTGYKTSLQTAAKLVVLKKKMNILDIGIGTGAFAALVEAKQAAVYGVDISEHMLGQCRKSHPNYTLRSGSFVPIPFENTLFDVVISSFAFHEVTPDEREHACAEIARVLKPGGLLCLLDIMFVSNTAQEEARRWSGQYWDDDEVYPQVGTLDTLLRRAAFRGIQWQQTAPCHWVVVARQAKA